MAVPTSTALKWAPSAANAVSLTPNNTAWANSSWVEIIASTSAATQIEQLVVASIANTPIEFEVDVGKGGAGSENLVTTFRGVGGSQTLGEWDQALGIVVDNITTATRVAVRLRKGAAGTTAWTFALGYHEATTSTNTTAEEATILPFSADGISLTPDGTAWANSAYIQLTAGIVSDVLVTHILHDLGQAVEFEYDISTGAGGSEVVRTTVSGNMEGTGGMRFVRLRNTLEITGSQRIAVRLRKQGTNVGAVKVALQTFDEAAALSVAVPQGTSRLLMGIGA